MQQIIYPNEVVQVDKVYEILNVKDPDLEANIRPSFIDEFIGQGRLKKNLQIFVESAKKRQAALDHILFHGAPGLGKTTLAQIIAKELNVNIKYISGPALSKQGDLAAIISTLEPFSVLFIDEIHRIPISVEEILYSAMEDFKIDFIIGEGVSAKSIRIDLPYFTLIGATTRYGLLSAPLRDRFGITLQLDVYSYAELSKIIIRSSSFLSLDITKEAANALAIRSRGTPRIANKLLRRIRDFAIIDDKVLINEQDIISTLKEIGIDNNGLDKIDRKYLQSLNNFYQGGPVGIDTIVSILGLSKDTIEDTVEPFLLQNGYIAKTPRGRVIATKGWDYLKIKPLKNNKSNKTIDLFEE